MADLASRRLARSSIDVDALLVRIECDAVEDARCSRERLGIADTCIGSVGRKAKTEREKPGPTGVHQVSSFHANSLFSRTSPAGIDMTVLCEQSIGQEYTPAGTPSGFAC